MTTLAKPSPLQSLLDKGLIDSQARDMLLSGHPQDANASLGTRILEQDLMTEESLLQFWAGELDLGLHRSIPDESIDTDLVTLVPIHFLKSAYLFPLHRNGNTLHVLTFDPTITGPLDHLLHLFQCDHLKLELAPREEIISAINRAFGQVSPGADSFIQDLQESDEAFFTELEEKISADLLDETSEAPIIKLVNHILSQAVHFKASDIHIEPYQNELKVRFRMDGVLYNIHSLPKKIHPALVSRVKILAQLNIAEKRAPQDGRIQIRIGNREVDLRVSSLPTAFGERMVLRLLEKDIRILNIHEIGLSPEHQDHLKRLIKISHGIILVTGPTGSGKTTTLYSALNEINTPDKNILTIEDPIEYQLDGIGQMQVNARIGLTFANGLRSMVRQDPDVILVGEIRDLETAEIAIQAALTGHLVFSTLHTNDAAGAITRLIDMGIEPFLVSSSVQAILAQRLIRTLCPHCKQEYVPENAELWEIGLEQTQPPLKLYRGEGCDKCMNTGYKGRSGIFEFLNVSDSIQSLMLKSSESHQLRQQAIREGMRTLRQDGVRKVMSGLTTIDEVLRVTQV
jgi:general secretion pathway protein E